MYLYSDGAFDRQEESDTLVSTDLSRAAYEAAGLREYDVDRLNAGDWANYTRTFPTDGAFRLLLRARASAAQLVELSRVTSDPSQPGQEAVVLGYFRVPAGSSYGLVALTDLAGAKELAVNLTGRQTLRLTAVEAAGNLWLNYVMFVPTTKAVVAPTHHRGQ